MNFVGVVHKEPGTSYGVHFPDVPGCMSAGGTLEDLRLMAQEALALSLDGLREDGAKLPKPSPLARIARLDDAAEAVALIVVPYVPGFCVPKPKKKPAQRAAAKARKPHTRSAA